MRSGRLRTIVARVLSRAGLEGSVSCQQDELRAKGGCRGTVRAASCSAGPLPKPLPLPLGLVFIFLAGWVKGQTTGREKPQVRACWR